MNDFKCFIGFHKYEIFKEEPIVSAVTGVVIGKFIISRCTNCGKHKVIRINTMDIIREL
jgi:hypothetical protein